MKILAPIDVDAQDSAVPLVTFGDVDTGIVAFSGKGSTIVTHEVDGVTALTLTSANATGSIEYRLSKLNMTGYELRTEFTSPANLTFSQNNWNVGDPPARNIRVSANAGLNISGIANFMAYQVCTIFNVGSNTITLLHDSTSTTTNRFLCPGSSNYSLIRDSAVDIWYDAVTDRWRVIA